MKTDPVTYCNCMEEVRRRISLVKSVQNGSITTGVEFSDMELMFVQFRKSLELIAFGSLTANKQIYAAAHANFATHWRAKRMLETVEKLNPDFYPIPIQPPKVLENGIKHCERIEGGFLTKDDFVLLYDKASEILHARNPFTTEDPVVQIGYSVEQWVSRIQRLLALHLIHLTDGSKWIVEIRNEGPVTLWLASPAINQ